MTFERLIWQGALLRKSRRRSAVLCVALLSLSFIAYASLGPAAGSLRRQIAAFGLLVSVALTIACECARDRPARAATDALLSSLGFSRQQLATLLVLESVVLGGVGALLGVGVCVALRSELGWLCARLSPAWSALRIAPETLSFGFVSALLASALGAAWPAYRLARSELSGPAVHHELGSGHEG